MPRIYVEFSGLDQIGSRCKTVASRVDTIQSNFQRTVRQLDWDIRFESNINSTATQIAKTLEQYSRTLETYQRFIEDTHVEIRKELEMKKFLPIGSVVLLKESQKRIMIVGVKQKQANSDKVWDYSACLYPEGILDPEKLFLFDTEQIERLYFIGLQDGEGLAFLNKINHLDDNADTTN